MCTTKLTPFTVSKDEWNTKEDTGKSMKNVSYMSKTPLRLKQHQTVDMTPPTSREALQHFLGMIKYPSKFIPNLPQTSAPLRPLLEKDTEWQWYQVHLQWFFQH